MPNNNFVRDILPSSARRANPPFGREKEKDKEKTKEVLIPIRKIKNPLFNFHVPKKLPRVGGLKFITAAVLSYVFVLTLISFFSGVEVKLTLKSEEFEVNSVFSAGASGAQIMAEGVVFSDQISKTSKTSAVKDFNERSSGTLVIYNAYSSDAQSLVAGTRFETSDGKIYRVNKPIVVPGAKIIDGKIEPSSIEAQVFADEPGDGFNIGLSDFTIPGFKGSPKYDRFYARSKTAMSGGFVGRANVVSEKEAAELGKIMEEELKQALFAKIKTDLPDGFFVPEGVYQYSTEVVSVEPAVGLKSDEFKMTTNGKLKVFFVRKEDVKNSVLENYKNDPNFENIDIPNFGDLKIAAENQDFKSLTLKLRVSGRAKAVWKVKPELLASDLVLAASANERLAVLKNYPQIERAEVVYKPFWWRVFPDKTSKVVIGNTY